MITGQLRNQVDRLWTEFWTGGITNPLTVIEQISFLMFARLLDIAETRAEKRSARLGKFHLGQFSKDEQHLRWGHFKNLPADQMLKTVRDGVFDHFRKLSDENSTFAEYMKDAQLMIVKPSLLVSAVNMIDALPLDRGRHEGRPLRVPAQQADHGRDQRPVPHAAAHHPVDGRPARAEADRDRRRPGLRHGGLPRRRDAAPDGKVHVARGRHRPRGRAKNVLRRPARTLPQAHPIADCSTAIDFDSTMLRIAAMNLMLHGVESPDIHYQDIAEQLVPRTVSQRRPSTAST